MKQNNKITITGDLGSGKSSVCQILKEKLGFNIVSVGSVQRKLAQERNMTTIEFNKYMEAHPEIDIECDNRVKELGQQDTPMIFDSRLAWYFVPNSFKIYLYTDINTSAKRVFLDKNRINECYSDIEVTKQNIRERKNSEVQRFKTQYDIILDDYSNYDLIIDTSYATQGYVAEVILLCFNSFIKGEVFNKFWFSPKSLLPTQNIREHSHKYTQSIVDSVREFGFQQDKPIKVLKYGEKFYIYDGHKRVSAALTNHIDLVPVVLMGQDEELLPYGQSVAEYIKDNYNLSYIYDWEAMHQINLNNIE